MRLSVIGCGYLGAVHAACMASMGHEVVGLDVDAHKIAVLQSGQSPIYEPGLGELLQVGLGNGHLRFTTDPMALRDAEVHFIAVGTPQQSGSYAADTSFVWSAVRLIVEAATEASRRPMLVVGKSTVPVGTAAEIDQALTDAGLDAVLVWNPEFLREGTAVADTLEPDRLVYGLPEDLRRGTNGRVALDEVYRPLLDAGVPRFTMSYPTAELVKVAANSFLATKVSFINAMAELCQATGADVTKLADALGADERIGNKFLNAGLGFGGGCLPKDIRAFMSRAEELGVSEALTFLGEVDSINLRRRDHAVDIAQTLLPDLVGARIAVLGASFKVGSDDLRDSPALDVARRLAARGANVVVFDPVAGPAVRASTREVDVADTLEESLTGANLVLLATAWEQFLTVDPGLAKSLVADATIIDGRNALDPHRWRAAGWDYHGMGRGASIWS